MSNNPCACCGVVPPSDSQVQGWGYSPESEWLCKVCLDRRRARGYVQCATCTVGYTVAEGTDEDARREALAKGGFFTTQSGELRCPDCKTEKGHFTEGAREMRLVCARCPCEFVTTEAGDWFEVERLAGERADWRRANDGMICRDCENKERTARGLPEIPEPEAEHEVDPGPDPGHGLDFEVQLGPPALFGDAELDAMATVGKALDDLDGLARTRVLDWARARYDDEYLAALIAGRQVHYEGPGFEKPREPSLYGIPGPNPGEMRVPT